MTLAETYACANAVPMTKPEIVDTFYPLSHPLDKTILVHAFAGTIKQENGQVQAAFPAKIYDHFDEVIALMRPIVEPQGYRFLQIGAPNEPQLRGIESVCGKTTVHQCAYLVKNAALLIGNDSMWAHVAGAYGRPQVHVYGPTSTPHIPHWHDPKVSAFIESHRKGQKPSYASHEAPKTINWIPPEQIVNEALRILHGEPHPEEGVPPNGIRGILQLTRRTLFIGDAYNHRVVELVPNVVMDPRIQLSGPLIVRMDLHHDEAMLLSNLQLRRCVIAASREIDPSLLAQAKPQIVSMRIEVDNVSPSWIKAVKRLGVPVAFVSREPDPAKLAALRLALYEAVQFDHYVPQTKEDFLKGAAIYLNKDLDKDLKIDTLRFKTNKVLLSDGKVYLSNAHRLAGKPTPAPEQNGGDVIDDPLFWEDVIHYLVYQP